MQIHEASHTITIETPEGFEVMMHVGIGTVAPKGRGFQLRTGEGAEEPTWISGWTHYAVAGNTGIDCLDAWVEELLTSG